ncbi:MAG: glycosyltransferase [Candidatus Marinimicrobia bacterium]|nr:glycosyltransferase [Candidatus Neomarinimicrobiota bacterium]
MKISVIIVSYNVKEFLQQCILSLKNALSNINHEIIVVDNNSVDGTTEIIKYKFPEIRLIENDENRGFAAACNQGLKESGGEYLLLLNPDTMIQEDTVSTLIDFFERVPDAGAAGCKILNADGSLQLACRRSFPTPLVALPKLLGLSRLFPKVKIFGKYNLTYEDPDKLIEVDAISGSFLMFRREVYEKIQGLDETFFMYGEDLDYCYRIKKAGWKIYYVPDTKIIHYKGESAKLASFDNFIIFYKAMDIFVKKHFSRSYSVIFDLFLRMGILFRGIVSLIGSFFRRHVTLFVDGLAVIFAILLAHYLQPYPIQDYSMVFSMLVFYLLLWLGIGYTIGLYERRDLSYSRAAIAAVLSFFASMIFYLIFRGFVYSPHLLIWSFLMVMLFLPGWRIFLLFLQRRRVISPKSPLSRALLSRRTIIAGTGEEGERIAKKLQSHIEHGFEILGFVDKKYALKQNLGFPFLGVVGDLGEIIRIHRATEIIFTTDEFSNDDILNILDRLKKIRVNVKIVPRNLDYIIGKSSVEKIEDIPLIEVEYNMYRLGNRISKRAFDIFLSLFTFIILAPVVIPFALLSGYRFSTEKFLGKESSVFNGIVFKKRNGNHVRPTIERFPLLLSILRGKMSFVGSELLTANPHLRHLRCKPGMTGLFQLQETHNPNEIDKQNYEYYYMQNHSLFLDVEILLKALLNI